MKTPFNKPLRPQDPFEVATPAEAVEQLGNQNEARIALQGDAPEVAAIDMADINNGASGTGSVGPITDVKIEPTNSVRVRVQNESGSESMLVPDPGFHCLAKINDAVAKLIMYGGDLNWEIGTPDLVRPTDDDNTGKGLDALGMVNRWLSID